MKKMFQILMSLFKKKPTPKSLMLGNEVKILKIIASCYTVKQLSIVSKWLDKVSREKLLSDKLLRQGYYMASACRAITLSKGTIIRNSLNFEDIVSDIE